jgi:hypothetical protein
MYIYYVPSCKFTYVISCAFMQLQLLWLITQSVDMYHRAFQLLQPFISSLAAMHLFSINILVLSPWNVHLSFFSYLVFVHQQHLYRSIFFSPKWCFIQQSDKAFLFAYVWDSRRPAVVEKWQTTVCSMVTRYIFLSLSVHTWTLHFCTTVLHPCNDHKRFYSKKSH